MRRMLIAPVLVVLLAAGCGGGDGDDVVTDTTTTEAPAGDTTTSAPGELPGEPIDVPPAEGAELAVVGVEADDSLNVRSGPGTDFEVVAELDPLATDVVATGENRSIEGEGVWAEVRVDGETGWVDTSFVAHLGETRDITTEIAPTPDDLLLADTMLQLGQEVAEMRASEEPPSRIVVVDGPTVGDLGEITVDVLGVGDDSVAGERLHVFGQPEGGEAFRLRTVEATTLCARGVTDEGLCV